MHTYNSLLSRCSVLLPPVANAFKAGITTLLLEGRVDELKREVVREALESTELLGTDNHEFRVLLASIKGYAATLLRHEHRLAGEERYQILLAIHDASDWLEVIIEHLLEFLQLETGQATPERSLVDMVRLASEAIDVIEERVTASLQGHFVFRLRLGNADGTTGLVVPPILADLRRLREMLDHLLENAIKFLPKGGQVTVTLRLVVQVSP